MALTAGQLVTLRKQSQFSSLYLAVLEPPTIFAAQINDTFADSDMVVEFEFDNVTTGAYGDIVPGQTVYIGSSAGLFDLGICRARKAAGLTTLYIGEVSDIAFADDVYVTVVDEFNIWPRHVQIDTSEEVYMDVDVDYSDQHEDFDPVPVLGPHAVAWLVGGTVDVALDASDSYVYDSTISAYAWESLPAAGTSFDNAAIATPVITITAAGTYRIKCLVTAANGKSFTGYRYIFVYSAASMPITDFTLETVMGDAQAGGWSFSVILNDSTDWAAMRYRALCILFSKDTYGGTEGSVGQVADRENILAAGYISTLVNVNDPEHAPKKYNVHGLYWWLQQIQSFTPGVELSSIPSAWTDMTGLTVDRGLWHFLHWRTTATLMTDVILTGDTRNASAIESGAGSMWEQIREMSEATILARPITDKYGRLHVAIPYNLLPDADRAAASDEVMTFTDADLPKEVSFEKVLPATSQVNLSGVQVSSEGEGNALFSLSQGHTPALLGSVTVIDRLLLGSQALSNSLAGLIFGSQNNAYPYIPITLVGNNRSFDIAPVQHAVVALDDFSGIIIPDVIEYDLDYASGKLSVFMTFHAETAEALSVDGDIPIGSDTFLALPKLPPLPKLPALPKLSPVVPFVWSEDILSVGPKKVMIETANFGFIYTENFDEASPVWNFMNAGLEARTAFYGSIERIVACPSGAIFAQLGEGYVYWTPGLGSFWELLVTGADVDPGYGADELHGLGANTNKDEEIAIFGTNSFWIGDRSGVAITATGLDSEEIVGDVTFGQGKWFQTHCEENAFDTAAWSRFSAAGANEVDTTNYPSGGYPAAKQRHKRSGTGDYIYYWTTNGALYRITGNNGATIAAVASCGSSAYYPPNLYAVSPSGQRLMGGRPSIVPQRSTDYGATFGNSGGGLSIGYTVFENCASELAWIIGTVQVLQYTGDNGDTWTAKAGNLATLAPLCEIEHIVFISW